MKKFLKILLSLAACFAIIVSLVDLTTVSAATHTHTFENGRCSCGTLRLEGESADMSNIKSSDSDRQGTLIEDVPTASGGKSFGNWSLAGNYVVWKFSLDKDTTAPVTLSLASCGSGTTLSDSHAIIVNGVTAAWTTETIPAIVGQNWYDFKEYSTNPVSFKKGDNKIVLKNVNGYASNIDYIDVGFSSDITVEEHSHECSRVCEICKGCLDDKCTETVCSNKCSCVRHVHDFVKNRCSCGALKIEAETATVEGTLVHYDQSVESDQFVLSDASASGGGYVGNWGSTDNVMTFQFNVSKAQDVSLEIVFAPCKLGATWVLPTEGNRDDKATGVLWPFEVRVNTSYEDSNVVALFEKSTIPSFDGKNYFNWYAVKTQPVHLKEGTNYIQIESWDYYFANFDYIVVGVSEDTEVTIPDVVDFIKPVVTLSIEEKEYKTGEEISFTVSVTDNVSSIDKLKVETKVYLNYNRDSQEEIAFSDGKFTPTKIGRYTIVVTATDEAGNVSTKTGTLTVEDESSSPVTPDAPEQPGDPSASDEGAGSVKDDEETEGLFAAIGNWEPVAGWPLKVFAWNTMWIPFCIVVVLAGGGYFLAIWLFGRMKLSSAEKEYVEKSSEELKKVDRKVRKEELNKQSKRVKRVVSWNITSKYIWTSVVAVVLVISMIATPVLTTTMPYIKEALFPTNALSPDSEAAKLAIGEAKENVVEIESEGIVLLKNEKEDDNPVLPLDPTSDKDKKINIFGSSAFGMLYGGGGSGVFVTNAVSYGNELFATRLEDALESEGFEYNKNLYNLVANYFESKTYKITETSYDIQCQNNVFGGNTKDDKGNVLIDETRFPYDNEPEVSAYEKTYGGLDGKTLLEDAKAYSDIALYAVSRAGSEDGDLTYQKTCLIDREVAMINLLKTNFKRVIILINSSNTMELGALDDDGVDAVLWVGHPGLTGNTAVAQVIAGKINPSGKMVDTWVYNGQDNPATLMFGIEGTATYSNRDTAYQVYYEGVYLGYRYYVTRALTDPTYKYEDHVQWSFGYGLSYTTFEKHITECIIDPEADKVSVQVAVTNTGDVTSKEVVQIYFNAPYTGTVEKPYYELAGFSKTDDIEPGETYYARVEFAFSDMSSWYSAYNGGTGAYLLEKGDYTISLRDNVWDLTKDEDLEDDFVNEYVYNLIDDRAITTDPVSGNTVTTRFADVEYGPNDSKVTYLSRSDWAGTFPTADKINRKASDTVKKASVIKSYSTDNLISEKDTSEYIQGVDYGLKLSDFKGLGINDTLEVYGETYTWDDLVNQMTVTDMCTLVDSRFMGTVKIDSVGKPETGDDDGPSSVSIYGVGYPSEVVVASSWNPDMGYLLGYSLGKEGASMGMSGWYAPGLNIHRSAAGGRNFEYYSEDPLISGLMGAATVKGAAKFGVYTYIKHFVLNDQETERRTIQVWANEQSMREIYLRAFEIAIKESGSLGIMSSFNFLGTTWAGASKALMTDVLRTEWGFEGVAVTDWVNAGTMPVSSGLRAGNDLWLGKNTGYSAAAAYKETPDDVHYLLRQACKRILVAVANSNAVWTEEDYEAVGIDNPPKVNHEALEGYH